MQYYHYYKTSLEYGLHTGKKEEKSWECCRLTSDLPVRATVSTREGRSAMYNTIQNKTKHIKIRRPQRRPQFHTANSFQSSVVAMVLCPNSLSASRAGCQLSYGTASKNSNRIHVVLFWPQTGARFLGSLPSRPFPLTVSVEKRLEDRRA